MKTSKLLAMLALAGFCGTSQTQARSHRLEIKQLEKHRAQWVEAHREARERLSELDGPEDFEPGDGIAEADGEELENDGIATQGNWAAAEKEIWSLNWDLKNPEVIRERELQEARLREAAREMARIDKAIRKEKLRERRESDPSAALG